MILAPALGALRLKLAGYLVRLAADHRIAAHYRSDHDATASKRRSDLAVAPVRMKVADVVSAADADEDFVSDL